MPPPPTLTPTHRSRKGGKNSQKSHSQGKCSEMAHWLLWQPTLPCSCCLSHDPSVTLFLDWRQRMKTALKYIFFSFRCVEDMHNLTKKKKTQKPELQGRGKSPGPAIRWPSFLWDPDHLCRGRRVLGFLWVKGQQTRRRNLKRLEGA